MPAVLHEVPLPRYVPFWAVHWVGVRTWHVIVPDGSRMQQAPRGAHMSAVQVVLSPRYTPLWDAHCACVKIWQVTPVELVTQHAPVGGGGQLAVAQAVLSPR